MTDETGAVVERLSFDVWGKRRMTTGAPDPAGSITSSIDRGFTGHEMLDEVALVHMNGRLYDATIARMVSADPVVSDPLSALAFNRYAYVDNNPCTYTDPTGYLKLGGIIGKIIGAILHPITLIPGVNNFIAHNQFAQTLVMLSSAACGPYAAGCAAGNAAYLSSLNGGSLGDMFKAAAIAYATAEAFHAVGVATNGDFPGGVNANGLTQAQWAGTGEYFANVAGHAIVGCASTAAQGGKCGAGALAAGFGAAAGPFVPSDWGRIGKMTAIAVIGGTGSVVGGGKFGSGAVTGAFGYLFNEMAAYGQSSELDRDVNYGQFDPDSPFYGGAVSDPTSPWLEDAASIVAIRPLRWVLSAFRWMGASSQYGLPPSGISPPGVASDTLQIGPASRTGSPGLSLYEPSGGEWRYFSGDKYHNPHWDYNPHTQWNSPWQNISIDGKPILK